jgi:hypothetical protein
VGRARTANLRLTVLNRQRKILQRNSEKRPAALRRGFAHAMETSTEQPFAESSALLRREADKIASSMDLSRAALDYLYQNSRVQWERGEWESAVRKACAVNLAMASLRRTLDWESLMDAEATAQTFAKLESARSNTKGTLILTCHGGYHVAANGLFRKRFPGRAVISPSGLLSRESGNLDNLGDSMFGALRLLQAGGILIMAPDGPRGRKSAPRKIFGQVVLGPDGASLLAHAAQAVTVWYNVARTGDRFAPTIAIGPTVMAGESEKQFSQRLNNFYSNKLEELFSGDPRNITLSPAWVRHFREASRSQKKQSRRSFFGRDTPLKTPKWAKSFWRS